MTSGARRKTEARGRQLMEQGAGLTAGTGRVEIVGVVNPNKDVYTGQRSSVRNGSTPKRCHHRPIVRGRPSIAARGSYALTDVSL